MIIIIIIYNNNGNNKKMIITIITRIDVYETLYPNRCLYIKVAKLRTGMGSAEMSHLQKKSNRKAMNRNWSNQKANPALKTKAGINKYYK